MKDYYYILGLERQASAAEIRRSFRKLSVKFHPDKNEGDIFFEARFKEISEAYDTLIDKSARRLYDLEWKRFFDRAPDGSQSEDANLPQILQFSVDKTHVLDGDKITITWKTVHADQISITGLGDHLKPKGSKSMKIHHIKKQGYFIKIYALNSKLLKTAIQDIRIYHKLHEDDMAYFQKKSGYHTTGGRGDTPIFTWGAGLERTEIIGIIQKNWIMFGLGLFLLLFTSCYHELIGGSRFEMILFDLIWSLLLAAIFSGAMVYVYGLFKSSNESFSIQLFRNIPIYLIIICLFRLIVMYNVQGMEGLI